MFKAEGLQILSSVPRHVCPTAGYAKYSASGRTFLKCRRSDPSHVEGNGLCAQVTFIDRTLKKDFAGKRMQTARVAVAANQGGRGRRQEMAIAARKRCADYSSPVQKISGDSGIIARPSMLTAAEIWRSASVRAARSGNSTTGSKLRPRSKIPYLPARAERQICPDPERPLTHHQQVPCTASPHNDRNKCH